MNIMRLFGVALTATLVCSAVACKARRIRSAATLQSVGDGKNLEELVEQLNLYLDEVNQDLGALELNADRGNEVAMFDELQLNYTSIRVQAIPLE